MMMTECGFPCCLLGLLLQPDGHQSLHRQFFTNDAFLHAAAPLSGHSHATVS